MRVALGDVLGGEVEIPADVQHYQVKRIVDGQEQIVYRGYGPEGVLHDLDRIMYVEPDGFMLLWKREWPASTDWTVEWEEIEEQCSNGEK